MAKKQTKDSAKGVKDILKKGARDIDNLYTKEKKAGGAVLSIISNASSLLRTITDIQKGVDENDVNNVAWAYEKISEKSYRKLIDVDKNTALLQLERHADTMLVKDYRAKKEHIESTADSVSAIVEEAAVCVCGWLIEQHAHIYQKFYGIKDPDLFFAIYDAILDTDAGRLSVGNEFGNPFVGVEQQLDEVSYILHAIAGWEK